MNGNNTTWTLVGLGAAISMAVYFGLGVILDLYIVHFLIPLGTAQRPDGQAAMFMTNLAAVLGAVIGLVLALRRQQQLVQAGMIGLLNGLLFTTFIAIIWIVSNPQNLSLSNISNLVLFGPLMLEAMFLFLWSIYLLGNALFNAKGSH